jgi:hypothetical protein
MGFSYTAKAGDTLRIVDECCKLSNPDEPSSNVFVVDGVRYMFETDRKELKDGGITGDVSMFLPDGVHVRPMGKFRVSGAGRIAPNSVAAFRKLYAKFSEKATANLAKRSPFFGRR